MSEDAKKNTGNLNSGNWNSGTCNSGNWNSGNCNSGTCNSGDCNSGNCNSGDCNSGNCNSGNCNSGNWNSGNCNSGNWNSGTCNSGNWNSGFFCTDTPKPKFFDVEFDGTWEQARYLVPLVALNTGTIFVPTNEMTTEEKQAHPEHITTGGYLRPGLTYKDAWAKAWSEADATTRQRFLDLPNFDADKFLEITGVDVRQRETVVVGGASHEVSAEQLQRIHEILAIG
jgi:hypothetical protein